MVPNNKLNHINTQPPRRPCSTIIKSQHFNIFANWIEKKEILDYNKVKHIHCRFKLIYRASRDGKTVAAFHEKCDNKGATIVIVKIKGSEQIVGGYNPFDLDSRGRCKNTNDSCLQIERTQKRQR